MINNFENKIDIKDYFYNANSTIDTLLLWNELENKDTYKKILKIHLNITYGLI